MWQKTEILCPDCAKQGKFNYLWESKFKFFCIHFVSCGFGVIKAAVSESRKG